MKMGKRKVLLVSYEMSYTGSPIAVLNLAKAFKKLKYEIDVWTLNEGKFQVEFEKLGIRVESIAFKSMDNFIIEKRLSAYEYIIANTIFCVDFAEWASGFSNTILYIHEAQNLVDLVKACNIRRKSIENILNVFCVSEYARKSILNQYNIKNLYVLPNYVEKVFLLKQKKKDNKIRFLVSGTYEYRKGQDVVEEAFLELPREFREKAELHFVGAMPEWSREYQDCIKKKQIDNIYIHNEIRDRTELFRFYDYMDVIVVASRDESCSLVALEAAMLKKCIFVTENTGASYVVANKKFVLPTGDVKRLKQEMQYVISINRRVLRHEGIENHKLYKKYGTKRFFCKQLKNIMEMIERGNEIGK